MTSYPLRRVAALARTLQTYADWDWANAGREAVARPHPDQTHPVIYGPFPFARSLVNFHLEQRAEKWLREGRTEDGIRLVFLSHKARPIAETLVVMPLSGFEQLSTLAMQHHAARHDLDRRSAE